MSDVASILSQALDAGPDPVKMPCDVLTSMFPGVASLEIEKRGAAKTGMDSDGRFRTTLGRAVQVDPPGWPQAVPTVVPRFSPG